MEPPKFMDRALQREILLELQNAYPGAADLQRLDPDEDLPSIQALAYLEGHELIKVAWSKRIDIRGKQPMNATITAKGLDFLADDGGLSAILGVVTVRVHEDTMKQWLLAAVEKAPVSPEERSGLQKAIRSLPGKAAEKLIDKLLDLGVEHLPGAIPQLHMWLTQVST